MQYHPQETVLMDSQAANGNGSTEDTFVMGNSIAHHVTLTELSFFLFLSFFLSFFRLNQTLRRRC
jgi:hypothetical protein